jgi:hypothetical protein
MDAIVFSLLMASFLSEELIHWINAIKRLIRNEDIHGAELMGKNVFLILVSFAGSWLIYAGTINIISTL